jgi:predicted transcriptional regulator of viral defense system
MRKKIDWVTTLAAEAKTNPLLRIGGAASKYGLARAAATKALNRLQKRGLVERVADGIYLNKLNAS